VWLIFHHSSMLYAPLGCPHVLFSKSIVAYWWVILQNFQQNYFNFPSLVSFMVYVNIQQMSFHINYLVLVFFKASLTIIVFSNYSLILFTIKILNLPMLISPLVHIVVIINEKNRFNYFLFMLCEIIWMNCHMFNL